MSLLSFSLVVGVIGVGVGGQCVCLETVGITKLEVRENSKISSLTYLLLLLLFLLFLVLLLVLG